MRRPPKTEAARSRAPADLRVAGVEPTASHAGDGRERLERLVVEVMAMPGRYRGLLFRFGDLDGIDGVLRDRCDPMSWSALERINHVADAMHASAKHVVALVDGDESRRCIVHIDAPRAGSNGAPSRAVLAALHASVTDLARAASSVEPESSSGAVLGDDLVTKVSDVLEDALLDAEFHLTEVEVLLEAATRRLQSA